MGVPRYTQLQERGRVLLEGRKQPRTTKRFLLQLCAVHDPRLEELAPGEDLNPCGARVATDRSWEPGCHVDVTTHTERKSASSLLPRRRRQEAYRWF